jgi:hypothetical protein
VRERERKKRILLNFSREFFRFSKLVPQAGRAPAGGKGGQRGSRLSTATRMIEGRQQMKVIEQAKVIEHSPDALIGKPKGLLRRI